MRERERVRERERGGGEGEIDIERERMSESKRIKKRLLFTDRSSSVTASRFCSSSCT